MKYKDGFYSYQNMCDLAANIYSWASSQASNYNEFLLAKHIEEQIRDSHEVEPEEDVVDFAPLVAFNEEVAIFIDNYKEIEYQIVYMTKEGVEFITNKASTLVEAVNSSIKDTQPNCILYAEKIDEAVDAIESTLSQDGIDLSVFDYNFTIIGAELDEIYSAIEPDTYEISKGWENFYVNIYDNFIEPHSQERLVNHDFEY